MTEKKQACSLPKNIRQIGTGTGNTRIYLEDYVYTYLHDNGELEEWSHRGFLLLGSVQREKDATRYFISGLIRLKDGFFKDGIVEFDDGTWAYIYQEMKKYYDDLEIVGWGQDIGGAVSGLAAEVERVHRQNFNIQKNVLFLLDGVEHDEAFYVFENNVLERREGYYVYYEKNPQMQEYMVETRKSKELDIAPEEIGEPLVRNYRETLLEKKNRLAAKRWNGVLYTTSMLLVLSVCVLGVSTVNNVEKMQNLEHAVTKISGQEKEPVRDGDTLVSPAMSVGAGQSDSGETAGGGGQSVETGEGDAADEPAETSVLEENKKAQTEDADDGQPEDAAKDNAKDDAKDSAQETDTLTAAQTYRLQGYYIVQKGDSLVSISKKIYGTPKKARRIGKLNGIDDMNKIFTGQKLRLP